MLIGDILRQNARYFANRPCLIQDDIRLSWAEVDQRTNRLANDLLKLGLTKGDRLAILCGNCYQYPEMYFATAKVGIISVPLNTRLALPELIRFLRYTKPKALVVSSNFADRGQSLQSEVPGLDHVIGLGEGHPFELDYDALIRESPSDLPHVNLSPDDVYVLGSTSGTTGIPKGAMLTHRMAVAAMMGWFAEIRWPQFGAMIQSNPQFFNPGGPANLQPILKGGAVIILPEFNPKNWAETVQRERPFFSILPTTMLQMVANYPDIEKYDTSSLGGILTGGSPIPRTLMQRATELFGNILYPTFGMCETYSCGGILRREHLVVDGPPEKLQRLASIGHPTTGMELRVVNEQGQDIKWGSDEVGELIVRGDQVIESYWEMPEETAASHKDGWFYTGDIGKQDAEGFIFLVDRKKDMIKSGSINVYSVEVEAAIGLHPAVLQVAVIGVPDPKWGEAVKALVVLRPGMSATEEEIIQHCREQLASYKKPQSVEFRESFPLGGTNKVLKRELREPYWVGHEKRI